MFSYLRVFVWLCDGIDLSRNELVDLLRQAMRQRSIATRTRTQYVLRFLHQHPP